MSVKNLLCLDFDGVICDSINECRLIAFNTYLKLKNPSNNYVVKVELIPDKVSERFNKYRYLVRPAKEYWLLMELAANSNLDITEEIFEYEKKMKIPGINLSEKVFFDTRNFFQNNYYSYWMGLHKIYDQFKVAWEGLKSKYNIYIVTNKNKKAVQAILKHNNIEIEDEYLFTNENFKTKIQALEKIVAKENALRDDLIFIDDSLATINETIKIFKNSYLANWGYNDSNDSIQSINNLSDLLEINIT